MCHLHERENKNMHPYLLIFTSRYLWRVGEKVGWGWKQDLVFTVLFGCHILGEHMNRLPTEV